MQLEVHFALRGISCTATRLICAFCLPYGAALFSVTGQGCACFLDRGAKDREASASGEAEEEEGLNAIFCRLCFIGVGYCRSL